MPILNRAPANRQSDSVDIRHPLWRRLALIGSGTVFFACAAVGGLSWYKQSTMIDQAIHAELDQAANSIFEALAAQSRSAMSVAATIAGEPGVADLVAANKRDELLQRYAQAMPSLKKDASIQLITFAKDPGIVVARVHSPGDFGDDLRERRKMIVETLRQGKPMVGIEPSRTGALSTFATIPLATTKGIVVGTVDVGTQLTDAYFERLKKAHHIDLAIQIDRDGHFATQNATFSAKTFLSPQEARSAIDGQAFRKIVDDNGESLAVTARPLQDFSGRNIGLLEFVDNVSTIVRQGQATLWETIIWSTLIGGLSLVLFVLFAISLSRPIRNLTLAMNRLASGDLQAEIEGQGRSDEIGAMAAAVQVFKDNAFALEKANADRERMEAAAEAEHRRNEAERQKLAKEQEDVVQALAAGLERLSEGDLTSHIDAAFAAEYKKLKDDFNTAVARLRQTMQVIAETTQEIKSGSGEIAQASDDLSRRTEQQAASLEETAAALDEITATVKKSADGASHARRVVETADDDAKKSAIVVRQAVEAMDAIAKSAQQIGQIIGVIDEIAFQTNLLALNAGVEAARAGDAGRGFAVVASEVRALAQRSAEAAKEIKGLISTSRTQVDNGVRLVAETGETLDRIMVQVTEINTIMAAIATGAKEQATGLAEVNTAINQMDQVTQKNAAMVEESTAASYSLSQDSEQLSNLVGQFRVGPAMDGAIRENEAMRRQLRQVAPHAFKPPAKGPAARVAAPRKEPARPAPVASKAVANGRASGGDSDGWEEF
jgi:methyl-accepting chemotaxis protein